MGLVVENKFIVNSLESVGEYQQHVFDLWEQHKYLVFYPPQIGKDRTLDQNDMSFELYTRIGKQLYGGDDKHARAECKLEIGVPLARQHDPIFREVYDKHIKPFDYGTKLAIMNILPVTSRLSKRVFREYIDKVFDTYAAKGVDFGDLVKQ